MKVKICGITNIEDACVAIAAGADMLGFNFYPKSPRYLSPEKAREIAARLRRSNGRRPLLVGVFVNSPLDEVRSILEIVQIDLVQLHGDESVSVVEQLNGRGFKALRPTSEEEALTQAEWFALYGPNAPMVLIDAYRKDQYGGTGHTADWTIATKLAQRYPILLAGGLTPDNVAEAIKQVRPWGVDVASGVECAPGKKDAVKMKLFVENAKQLMNNG
ncbi:MAG TPA: phosphoribosylanthranilate isomerase [Anaerolineae bacterium]|nr:phosphoribosylanthranilate isomerase [Anaerolineae bacterium]